MRIHEIRELSVKDLAGKIKDKAEELANLKFQHSLHQLNDTLKIRRARREFSRLVTIMREHEMGIHELKKAVISDEELM